MRKLSIGLIFTCVFINNLSFCQGEYKTSINEDKLAHMLYGIEHSTIELAMSLVDLLVFYDHSYNSIRLSENELYHGFLVISADQRLNQYIPINIHRANNATVLNAMEKFPLYNTPQYNRFKAMPKSIQFISSERGLEVVLEEKVQPRIKGNKLHEIVINDEIKKNPLLVSRLYYPWIKWFTHNSNKDQFPTDLSEKQKFSNSHVINSISTHFEDINQINRSGCESMGFKLSFCS